MCTEVKGLLILKWLLHWYRVCSKLAEYMYVYRSQGLIDFEVATALVQVH